MRAPLIVVTGTGTGIGKTHASEALLRCWTRTKRVCGLKPIETGVPNGEEGEDARRLREASTFHVKQSTALFVYPEPVSPHLAARRHARPILIEDVVALAEAARRACEGVLLELPGGLFSPLAPDLTNATLARALDASAVLLVASDRLGVLHEVTATCAAAASVGLVIDGLVLSAPAETDLSTGTNAVEIATVLSSAPPVIAVLRRAAAAALADDFTDALRRFSC